MLKECKDIRQNEGEPFRRLFADRAASLYVWTEPDGRICMFQLCYDQENHEKALTWRESSGFTHRSVNTGETHPLEYKKSPMLTCAGYFDKERVLSELRHTCSDMDQTIASFVLQTISGYSEQ